jgi:hypothetical protein
LEIGCAGKWIEGGSSFKLSNGLLEELHEKSVYSLWDAKLNDVDGFSRSVWKYVKLIELSKIHKEHWRSFCSLLSANFIQLQEDVEDVICWGKNEKYGIYSAKLGYLVLVMNDFDGLTQEWWKPPWKGNSPLKVKNLSWMEIEKKVLTWDNGLKRGWVGRGWCVLCWGSEETIQILFVNYSYSQKLWSAVCDELNLGDVVFDGDLKLWIIGWLARNHDSRYRSLALFLVYFIWWA